MDPKPFTRLAKPRSLGRFELPADLSAFYEVHEGVGLNSSTDRIVRLCRLEELKRISWRDVHIFGNEDWPGWEQFAALKIGVSPFFDEIVYVLEAPVCSAGAIFTIGVDVAGPGGSGTASLEPSLVLASSFTEWLKRLERCNWIEYGLVPGDIANLADFEQRQHRSYYHALNPRISWGNA